MVLKIKEKMKMMRLSKVLWLPGVVLVMTMFSGCLDDEYEPPEPVAYVSFYNASPNVPGLDIFVGTRRLNIDAFEYADTYEYLPFYPGDRELKFTPHKASNSLVDTTLTLVEERLYSIFIAGEAASVRTLLVEDDWELPGSGRAMVRFVHLSPDGPEADLEMSETELFTGNVFAEATEYEEVQAGEHTLVVKASADGEELVSSVEVNLQAGRIYTVALRGYLDPPNGNDNLLSIQVINNY